MKVNHYLIFTFLLAFAENLWCEPYIAVRTGFKCSVCHVNKSGGGKRTEYGFVYSQYKLLMQSALRDSQTISFDPKLNASISVGANFRVHQSHTLDYKWTPSNAQDSLGITAVDLPSRDNAGVNEGNLYLQLDLVKNFLTLYIDQTMAPASVNREMWGMVQLPLSGFLKFGNMLLPYGYRLMDDEAYVRKMTGYTYGTSGLGYEFGFEPGPFSWVVNTTTNRLSSVGSVVLNGLPIIRTMRLGGSYGTALKKQERYKDWTYGGFAGFSQGRFTVLAEMDQIRKDSTDLVAGYMELDVLPLQGLNLKFFWEHLWPDKKIPIARNGARRVVVGMEPFITQFIQLGLYYRQNDGPKQIGNQNQDEVVGRLHIFF